MMSCAVAQLAVRAACPRHGGDRNAQYPGQRGLYAKITVKNTTLSAKDSGKLPMAGSSFARILAVSSRQILSRAPTNLDCLTAREKPQTLDMHVAVVMETGYSTAFWG
ncbi:hypothetical protein AVEN_188815-1 [Araneus ventricosus]|uniref:Uncharacterized protein n=1 Tax=Araneus ventricosus TaxID=182803 RepID=A0A4Y2BSA3_ARAVE|nr:hypothetical protein AVEN_188815-1 [Araneus ventricosus]